MFIRNVFQNRNLTFLWISQMMAQSGDSIYQIGLLWLVLELSGSKSATGLVAMASYMPYVLFSILAGVAADRYDRKKIMLTSDALRFLLVIAVPVIHMTGHLNPTVLGINAFSIAIAASFFNPARDSFIPRIVKRENLLQANSLIQTSWQFSLLLGPSIAGIMIHYFGNINLFTACAAAYGLSFLFIFLIRQRARRNFAVRTPISFDEIKDGFVYVLKNRVILPLLLITVADNIFIMGPAIVGTPVFVKDVLKLEADAYAITQACYAVGMLIGTAALLTCGKRFNKGQILLLGMFLDGITFIPLYFAKTLIGTGIIIIIHSLAIPMLTVSRASLIQSIIPENMTGRVFAFINMAVIGMSAISSGLTGVILEYIDTPLLFLLIGIGGGLCGVVGWMFAHDLRKTE
jgi:MFS family permease